MIYNLSLKVYKSFKLLLIFLLMFSAQKLNAQNKFNLRTLGDDLSATIKQPTNWDKNDWLTIFGIAGLTYGTMHIDSYVREAVLNNNTYENSIPVEFGRIWGEPWLTLALGSGFYFHGIAADNSANKQLGFEIGESAFITAVITIILKYSFGRERPRESSDPFSFHPFSFRSDDFLSVNSGHTALAFSLSTVLAEHTANDYLKAALFIPAFMTAFSRVYQNHHWASDVLLGGIIGYSVAEFVTRLHKANNNDSNSDLMLEKPINIIDFRIPL